MMPALPTRRGLRGLRAQVKLCRSEKELLLGAYQVCRSCDRHVRAADPCCPFCGARSAPGPILRWPGRTSRSRLLAIGSALAVTGCSRSPENPANPVEATYVPHEASASGDVAAPLDADDDVPDADDDVLDAPAVEPPPPIWPDVAFADAALGTRVDGGFVCVNGAVCDPKTQFCDEYEYSAPASEGCYAFNDGGMPTDSWLQWCSNHLLPVPGSCTCRELDDAGAFAISCGSCYGSPPARRRRNGAPSPYAWRRRTVSCDLRSDRPRAAGSRCIGREA
jgi:hypothetical protein